MVPLLVSVMAMAFGTYLVLKGLKHLWKVEFPVALMIGFAVAVIFYFLARPWVVSRCKNQLNDKHGVNKLLPCL